MNFKDLIDDVFDGDRDKVRQLLNYTPQQMATLVHRNPRVMKLDNGDWITVHDRYNKVVPNE